MTNPNEIRESDLPAAPVPFYPSGTRLRCVCNASEDTDPRYKVGEVYPVYSHGPGHLFILLPSMETAAAYHWEFVPA